MPTSTYRFQTSGTDVVVGGQDWANTANALQDETLSGNPSLYATCEIVFIEEDESYWIKLTNPLLVSGSAIPSGATITGIRVVTKGYFGQSGTFHDDGTHGIRTHGVQLIIGGSASGTNYNPDRLWSFGHETTDTYQPPADPLWGLTPSVAQVTASNFGCRLRVYANQDGSIPDPGGNSFTTYMNYMYVRIDYSGGETPTQRLLVTSVPDGNGTLNPSGSNYYDHGTIVTIQATPDSGYDTRSWTKGVIGGASSPIAFSDAGTPGDANPDTFAVTMDADYAVTADFELFYTLTTAVSPPASGVVSPENGSKHFRSVIMLEATPATNYQFLNWTGDLSTTNNPATLSMNAAKSVQANFGLVSRTVSLVINGQGSVALSPDGTPVGPFDHLDSPQSIVFTHGTSTTLTATPSAGWGFDGFLDDGVPSASNPYNTTVSSDKTIVVFFVFNGWTLTVNIVGNGSVALTPPGGIYNNNAVVSLQATPASGWTFVGWGQDLSGSANPETITMNSHKVVYAYFEGSGGGSSGECQPDRNRWGCSS